MKVEEIFLPRLKRLQARLAELTLDGVLISSLENVRYLSGFTGSSGVLVLGQEAGHFLTDSRYTTQAEQEVAGLEITVFKDELEGIKDIIKKMGLVRVGFEPEGVSYGRHSALSSSLAKLKLVPLKEELGSLRIIKEKAEIDCIKQAIAIASNSFEQIRGQVKPGVRERDIALEMEYLMRKQGSGPISFELIVASGWRSALPHGVASEKKIEPGEMVILDFGASFKGYFSDETHSAVVPPVSDRHRRVYNVVKEAHDLAVAAVRPGARFIDIDQAARGHIERAGYGQFFGHGLGHGLGLAVHEPPAIAPNREGEAEEGMVFTIEPGIYIPGWAGVRLEDVVLVTADGCTVLTDTAKELWIV